MEISRSTEINLEIELDLLWWRNCIIKLNEVYRTPEKAVDQTTNPPAQATNATQRTSANSWVTSAKIYVPALNLSINKNIKI